MTLGTGHRAQGLLDLALQGMAGSQSSEPDLTLSQPFGEGRRTCAREATRACSPEESLGLRDNWPAVQGSSRCPAPRRKQPRQEVWPGGGRHPADSRGAGTRSGGCAPAGWSQGGELP